MDNTKTAEEVEKITARLYDFNNIPHSTGINPTAFQLGAKAMWGDQVEPLKKRIEELEATLVKCELTFGIIEEIHSILRRAQPIDLPDIIDEIEVDIPLIQAVIKDTLNQQHNGK